MSTSLIHKELQTGCQNRIKLKRDVPFKNINFYYGDFLSLNFYILAITMESRHPITEFCSHIIKTELFFRRRTVKC